MASADRRQFLRASAVGMFAGVIAGRPARGGLGVDDGPFATDNEAIRAARRAALAVLKPGAAELRRGLEVHADALVLEAYGFAPRAAIDGDAYRAAGEAGASDRELNDLRESMMMTRYATDAQERREFFAAFDAAGVTAIFQNTGEEGNDPLRLLGRLAHFTRATDLLGADLPKLVRPADARAAKAAGRHGLAFTTNGVPLGGRFEGVRDEFRELRLFHELGVRMMHVTYNRRNPLGDGAGEPTDAGLSDFGRQAVAELNRVGVIVDVAHSGWRTSLEAAKASTRPMVASHTTCGGVYRHFRGKPDEVGRAIAATGGLVGICCIPKYLGGSGDVAAFLDHLDHAINTFGSEHVAIGTDVAYTSRNDAAERAKAGRRPDGRPYLAVAGPRWEHLWPDDSYVVPKGAEPTLAWTNWPLFTVGLLQRGHSEAVIRRVLGENVLRVWEANHAPA
jgi:membrane dipeptidase